MLHAMDFRIRQYHMLERADARCLGCQSAEVHFRQSDALPRTPRSRVTRGPHRVRADETDQRLQEECLRPGSMRHCCNANQIQSGIAAVDVKRQTDMHLMQICPWRDLERHTSQIKEACIHSRPPGTDDARYSVATVRQWGVFPGSSLACTRDQVTQFVGRLTDRDSLPRRLRICLLWAQAKGVMRSHGRHSGRHLALTT